METIIVGSCEREKKGVFATLRFNRLQEESCANYYTVYSSIAKLFYLFLVTLLGCFVLVLLLDGGAKRLDLLAELIALLFTFGGLIFEKLPRRTQLFVSGLYLRIEDKIFDNKLP